MARHGPIVSLAAPLVAASLLAAFLLALAPAGPAHAADLGRPVPTPATGRFLATCEDLGHFCFGTGCGRDQTSAAQDCQAQCRGAAVMSVVPALCPLPGPASAPRTVLRRRG